MMMRTIFLCAAALGVSIGPAHAKKKAPPAGFEAALPQSPLPSPSPDGAIFNASSGYAPLHSGFRARSVGDTLTITLIEEVEASKAAGSKTQRSGNLGITPPTAGPLSFLNPESLKASAQSSFNGQGNATQRTSLNGEVSVTIADVRPNGTAFVKGQKMLMLSHGREWVQLSGIVRLSDIGHDNRLTSAQVADANIAYSGKGSVQNAGREGWLSRFFGKISPF